MISTYVRPVLLVLVVAAVFIVTFYISLQLWGTWHDNWSGYSAATTISDGVCNIAVVPVHGFIAGYDEADGSTYTTPAQVRAQLERASRESGIYGALIDIDSPGGYPVAADSIRQAIEVSNTYLYTAAVIGDYGTSGGYLAALGAEHMIASPFSDVGSIGITMSYLSSAGQNEELGLTYEALSTAPLKDYTDPDKPLTDEARDRILRDLGIMHDHFIDLIAARRNLPRETVDAIADGASLPGKLALEAGLIDGLGSRLEARQWFAEQLQVSVDEIILCE